jgi:cytoskeletal protein CcmA (bactofilin family)
VTNRSIPGYIGRGLRVRGSLLGAGDLIIDGRFEGEIKVDGTIEVGADGTVCSPVEAGSVVVQGLLEGAVLAGASVAIHPGGRLLGDVRADRVALSDGAYLEGAVIMDFDLPAELSERA